MMTDIFTLELPEEIIAFESINTDEFNEFSMLLEALDRMVNMESIDNWYIEASHVHGGVARTVGSALKNTAKNTYKTTAGIAGSYDQITTAGGDMISSGWNVIDALIKMIVRLASFFMKYISKIPDMIAKVLRFITDLPSDIYNKIKGNIKLYITAEDIPLLYRERLMTKLDGFLNTAQKLAQGNSWNYVKGTKIVKGIKKIFTQTDDQVCKQIMAYYREIGKVTFDQTTIDMGNRGNVITYLAAKKEIEFRDDRGNEFKGNYFHCINKLTKDLMNKQKEIKGTYDMLTAKYNSSQASLNYAELDKSEQQQIVNTINAVAAMIGVVSNIVKYTMTDMNTIYKNLNSIKAEELKKQGTDITNKEMAKRSMANVKDKRKAVNSKKK